MSKNEAMVMWMAAMQSREFEAMVRLRTADAPLDQPQGMQRRANLLREMADALEPKGETAF